MESQTTYQLRPYQEEILELLISKLENSLLPGRYLIQLPTGMGKTVVFASLIGRLGKRTLVIAHREELLHQAQEKICAIANFAGWQVDIILQSQPNTEAKVWIASVQTLVRGKRLEKIKPELIIIDEAHHSIAKSYQKIVDAFPEVPVIGFTATPTRTSRKEKIALSQFWSEDGLIYSYSIRKAILDSWLANILYYRVQTNINLDSVKTRMGDFSINELEKEVNVEARNQAILEKYRELGGGKAIIFCVNVAHVKTMSKIFSNAGIFSILLTGNTPKADRKNLIKTFKNTSMNDNIVICNCMVLSEGFDCPDVRMIILARPTQSEIVYLQQMGRGTRKAEGKDNVIVVDIADNCKKKNIQNCLTTVFRLAKNVNLDGDILKKIQKKTSSSSDVKEEKAQEREGDAYTQQEKINIELSKILFSCPLELERSIIKWRSTEEGIFSAQISAENYIKIVDEKLKYSLFVCSGNYNRHIFSSADIKEVVRRAVRGCEEHYAETWYMWKKYRSNNPPSEKQQYVLPKAIKFLGLDIEDPLSLSRDEAKEILGVYFEQTKNNPPSQKQIAYLQRNSYKGDIEKLTKREATKIIGKMKEEEQIEKETLKLIKNAITESQVLKLQGLGYKGELSGLTQKQATQIIADYEEDEAEQEEFF